MGDLVLSFYAGLIAMGGIVFYHCLKVLVVDIFMVFNPKKHINLKNLLFAISLMMTWGYIFSIRSYFWKWYYDKDRCPRSDANCADWMLESPILIGLILIAITGGGVAVYVFTQNRWGLLGCILAILFTGCTVAGNWLYLQSY